MAPGLPDAAGSINNRKHQSKAPVEVSLRAADVAKISRMSDNPLATSDEL